MDDITLHSDRQIIPPSPPGKTGEAAVTTIQQPQEPKTKVDRLKKYAWRITAFWTWMHWILTIFFGHDVLHSTEASVIARFVGVISKIGFAPGNPVVIPTLLKWGWYFVITGFSPSQLIGFGLYTLSFPIVALSLIGLRSLVRRAKSSASAPIGRALRKKKARLPIVVSAAFFLFGWFLLYGGATSSVQIMPGLVFAGILFIALVFRAFQRARPVEEADAAMFRDIGGAAAKWVRDTYERLRTQPPKTRLEAVTALILNGWMARFFRFFAMFLRGKKGRDRVSALILLDYSLSLLVLGVAAVLFWSLAAKLHAVPNALPLSLALNNSAMHFLPGMSEHGNHFSSWVDYGAAVSAWILFVIYVGPAASVLPKNQEEFVKRTGPTYRMLRLVMIKWGQYRHAVMRLRDKLN